MGLFSHRRISVIAASGALVASGIFTAAPASAALNDKPINVTGFQVKDLVVDNSYCKRVPVSMNTTVKGPGKVTQYSVWGGISDPRGRFNSPIYFRDSKKATGQICPDAGLGRYKIYIDNVTGSNVLTVGGSIHDWGYFDYQDKTTTSFQVRGKTKVSLSAKRFKKSVTLAANASVYAPEKYRYAQYNPKATLQVKTSGGKWKNLKSLKMSRGKATFKVTDAKKKTYRVTFPQSSWATAANSKAVAK